MTPADIEFGAAKMGDSDNWLVSWLIGLPAQEGSRSPDLMDVTEQSVQSASKPNN